jgi:flavodoxin/predicted small lipoprotein YifL
MKKVISFVLSIIMIFALSACGGKEKPSTKGTQSSAANTTPESTKEASTESKTTQNAKANSPNILVVYFTMPETDGVDTVAGASRVVVGGKVMGNTQFIAQAIQKTTGGNLFAIETVQRYPGNHATLVNQAADEQKANARPKLSTHIENLSNYDVIFIGYPIWWTEMPMPMYTFFEEYDFSGKTIVPFSTHGGSGLASTISTIADLEPNAKVIKDGFTVSRNSAASAEKDVVSWAQKLGFEKK